MEAAFPFAAFEGEEDFSASVEVAVPFWVFGVVEVCPDVVVDSLEPCETVCIAGEFVAFDHGDEGLNVYPPEFLVPFELLEGVSEAIHEVEDAAVLFVPTVFGFGEGNLDGFVDEGSVANASAEIHDEPHGFDGVSGVEETAVHTVDELAVGAEVLDDEAYLGAVEDVHYFVEAGLDGLVEEVFVEEGLDFEGYVAEYHGEGEALEGA